MENDFLVGDTIYRVFVSYGQCLCKEYKVARITENYYFVLDKKGKETMFSKNNDSLFKDKDKALAKLNNLKSMINEKIKAGDSFKVIMDGEIFNYTILPIHIEYQTAWTGASSDYGKRYENIKLVKSEASPSKGTISENTPLAQALIGKKIGDTFSYMVANRKFFGTVLEIERKE